ncbi:hypothetical protein [Pleionea sp. CnH1-48]|uniref:hypothetical protein n=1 Tax=Pleionea sp. CnH1-48 TaxID=2954494 RepID=UPI0020984490|nr:hypothetical protein [Pleionea sp. CnH1-48]MCO7225916.1 hypothetical protein [Pleionea sp. CnH1-48]
MKDDSPTKKPLQSKTILVSLLLAALGAIELKFPMLRDLLGQYYGVSYMVIGGVMAYLRKITNKPLAK